MVAWGCSVYHYARYYPDELYEHRKFMASRGNRLWSSQSWVGAGRASYFASPVPGSARAYLARLEVDLYDAAMRRSVSRGVTPDAAVDDLRAEFFEDQRPRPVPGWVDLPSHEPGAPLCSTSAYGWPVVCLASVLDDPFASNPNLVFRGAWMPTDWRPIISGSGLGARRAPTPLALPLRPNLPGLAVDSVLFGVLAWVAVFAPFRLRRAVRRRRGLCPYCAYDVRGLDVCPECGGGR